MVSASYTDFIRTYLTDLDPEPPARKEISMSEVLPKPAGGVDIGLNLPEQPVRIGHLPKFRLARKKKAIAILSYIKLETADAGDVYRMNDSNSIRARLPTVPKSQSCLKEKGTSLGDPRQPHESPDSLPLPASHLETLGVHTSHHSSVDTVDDLAARRSYKNRDEITVAPDVMGAVYEDKIKMFFNEHLHEDEEIRWIRDGAGYFDVRGKDKSGHERWVRVKVEEGDLMILPPGIYHRFTVDENNYIKAMRLFKEEPKWTPLNRGPEVDENPCRKEYIKAHQEAVVGA